MDRRIRERYTEAIFRDAANRFGAAEGGTRALDGFESFIYEFEAEGQRRILRIGHSLRRSESLIQAEVDWIHYLAAGGARVAQALLSRRGNLVEHLEDGHGGRFLATAFVKADGGPVSNDRWNGELLYRYGRLLGRLHALSKSFEPLPSSRRRPDLNHPELLDVEALLPRSEGRVLERYRHLLESFAPLPRDLDSYGLIHADAHRGNLFVDASGNLTLFDFDDCAYSWYANDLSIVLFYAVMYPRSPEEVLAFLTPFLQGYRMESELDSGWLAHVPGFLKLREITLYAVIHRSFDLKNLENAWIARFMAGRKERLEAGRPFYDFDFMERVAKRLQGKDGPASRID